MIKKHVKPSAAIHKVVLKSLKAIHISNLMLVVNGEATRTGKRADDKGKLSRYSKKSGEVIK
jgi:large subunit ribosomal protein L24